MLRLLNEIFNKTGVNASIAKGKEFSTVSQWIIMGKPMPDHHHESNQPT